MVSSKQDNGPESERWPSPSIASYDAMNSPLKTCCSFAINTSKYKVHLEREIALKHSTEFVFQKVRPFFTDGLIIIPLHSQTGQANNQQAVLPS